jgi:hypothetical protein
MIMLEKVYLKDEVSETQESNRAKNVAHKSIKAAFCPAIR